MASNHSEYKNYQFKKVKISKKTPKLGVEVRLRNFSRSSDRAKLEKGVQVLKEVVNSTRFKELVYGFMFKGNRTFHENNGMTNEEIYRHLMTGADIAFSKTDSFTFPVRSNS